MDVCFEEGLAELPLSYDLLGTQASPSSLHGTPAEMSDDVFTFGVGINAPYEYR